MNIKDIKIGDRFRKDLGDIKTLASSIQEIGLLQPKVVNQDNELIAGQRRLEACKLLGRTEVWLTRSSEGAR
jgi:ParB family transcriptional regulator, chromosome partitioning protein